MKTIRCQAKFFAEYNDENLRERIYGNYRIIYRIKPETIEIAAICHGSRLLENVFEP
jgi:plasmid stabilization system protein ParE